MRPLLRFVIFTVVLVGCTTLMAPAARAGARGAWANDSGNTLTVGVRAAGSPAAASSARTGDAGGSDSPAPACVVVPMPSYEALVGPGGPGPGQWMGVECNGQLPLNMTAGGLITWVPAGANPHGAGPTVAPAVLAQQAEASIHLPGQGIGVNPAGGGWVNFPEWFWLDSNDWHLYSATAAVAGVSATATAVPQYVIWQPGDGGSLRCNGPGSAYDPSRPAASQHSDCTWTYQADSADQPGGVYTVRATVHWAVTWAGAGTGGVLPALTTTATTTLAIGQIESVNNS